MKSGLCFVRTQIRSQLMSALFLLACIEGAVAGQWDDFTYSSDGSVITITDYTGYDASVVIPSLIAGLPVTRIGTAAFSDCYSTTSITIPTSVTNIGDYAFQITPLSGITIPTTVTRIGTGAFDGCTMLTSVSIPSSVTSIGDGLFNGCTKLASVTLPSSINRIAGRMFAGCTRLTSITIPNSISNIEFRAFDGCAALTNVTISASVTGIQWQAFSYCIQLARITIPSSVAGIADGAFIGCSQLTNITVDAGNPDYYSLAGVLFERNPSALVQYPGGVAGSYSIPAGITKIRSQAFERCSKLTSIIVPSTVTNIGGQTFYYCSNLSGVFFKGDPPAFGSYLFTNANNVIVYYLPGTTGWTSTFAGRPAVLWNPQVSSNDVYFGVQSNRFGFTISGSSNLVIVVKACTNLSNPIWATLATNTLTGGSSYFSDPQWTNYPNRFYRFTAP